MSKQVDVSFFIPVYRPNMQWLREAVESIVQLMRKGNAACELLLGDDGSPEPVNLEPFRTMAPELVRTWNFQVNRGIGAVSTDLAQKAAGRYIASFDQDDIMLPFDLDAEVAFLDGHTQFSASYAQKFLFNENGLTGEVHGDIYSPFQAFFSPKININAMLIRREILASNEYFKPVPYSRINHDIWLMLRMAEQGRYFFSHVPRCLYRVHSGQNSIGDNQRDWLLIGQDIICRHPAEYRELLLAEKPGTGNSPQQRELFHKLAGLVLFINQKNPGIIRKMLDYALLNFSDDFGVWEAYMHILSANPSYRDCLEVYRQAEARFKDNPEAMLVLSREFMNVIARHRLQCPDIISLYRKLELRRSTPPPIVVEAMKGLQVQKAPQNQGYYFV